MIKFLKIPIGCLVFILIFSAKPDNIWVKHLDKNGVQIFLRNCDNCNAKEFKAQAIINAPINKVYDLLLDFRNYPKWIYTNRSTFQIEKKSADEYIYYTIISCPRPTLDRDLIVDFKTVEKSDNRYYIKTSTLPTYINEKPNIVRVKVFNGSWELNKISDNETLVTTTSYSEPGGKVPLWLINTFIITGPYNTMLKMQELLSPKPIKK